jgi:signal transduction histidine kinase/phage shock protein PspC (stress-responsive transcriptional regulator)
MVAGVARGLADHLGVDVLVVRAAFVVLALSGGAGIALYAAFWAFVRPNPAQTGAVAVVSGAELASESAGGESSTGRRRYLALIAITVGGVLAVQSLGLGLPGPLLWPLALAGLGGAVLWHQADEAQRTRWRTAVGQGRPPKLVTTLAGAVLVVAGVAAFLAYHAQLNQVRDGLVATVVMVAGIAVISGPWWLGTLRALSAERRARIREQERAELAAHLHDSVLHTLALIQRQVDNPREVHRLARSQERELRSWLYRPAGDEAATEFGRALEKVVAEVEDAHGVTIEVVVVGDCPLDDRLAATLQAAREAMVNAAKHAGTDAVSVYAEVEPAKVTVFVRDRGRGFDLDAVPADRLGVKESIIGRMERHGGQANVRTSPGGGTEVRLEMSAQLART